MLATFDPLTGLLTVTFDRTINGDIVGTGYGDVIYDGATRWSSSVVTTYLGNGFVQQWLFDAVQVHPVEWEFVNGSPAVRNVVDDAPFPDGIYPVTIV